MRVLSKTYLGLFSGVAVLSILGTATLIGISEPVSARPVAIESPQTVANFADVVEGVSPAVVSVKVRSQAQPAALANGAGALPEKSSVATFF